MENIEIENDKEKRYITKDMLVDEEIVVNENIIDAEENGLYLPLVCTTIIAVNVVIFIMEIIAGALSNQESIINFGALYRPLVLKGEYWRVVSSMFLHGGFYHLLSNMVILYIMGINFEKFFERKKAIAVYFISGILGALLSVSMSDTPSVGASGAIFGVMGAVGFYLMNNKEMFNEINKRTGKALIIVGIFWILNGMASPMVDNYAHIGGFIGGVAAAFLLKGRTEMEYREYIIKNRKNLK